MKFPLLSFLLIASGHVALGQSPYAALQVPNQIQYPGRVATGTGGAWAGTEGYFVFALVQGTTVLWNNWQGTASPADPGTVTPGAGQVLTLAVNQGVFSIRLGDGSGTNQQIPATVFFDSTANAVRTGVKLAVWFSPDDITFTRLSPDVEFTAAPYAMVAGIAETVQDRAITTLKIADGQVTGNKLADGSIPASKIDGNFSQSLVPAGTILSFGGTIAPAGYLMCAGQLYSKSTYPALSTVLNNAFGGDATMFRVPDLRGRFLRGTDDPDGEGGAYSAAGRDPNVSAVDRPQMNDGGNTGNAVGSVQADELKNHSHLMNSVVFDSGGRNGTTVAGGTNYGFSYSSPYPATSSTGGIETRPINANVNYIIKY